MNDERRSRWGAGWSANAKRWSVFDNEPADDDSVFGVMLTSSTLFCSEVVLAEKVWVEHSDFFTACRPVGTLFISNQYSHGNKAHYTLYKGTNTHTNTAPGTSRHHYGSTPDGYKPEMRWEHVPSFPTICDMATFGERTWRLLVMENRVIPPIISMGNVVWFMMTFTIISTSRPWIWTLCGQWWWMTMELPSETWGSWAVWTWLGPQHNVYHFEAENVLSLHLRYIPHDFDSM